MSAFDEMEIDAIYNNLTVIDVNRFYIRKGTWGIKCKCICGNICIVAPNDLLREAQKSCGCKSMYAEKYNDGALLESAINAKLKQIKAHAKERGQRWKLSNEQAILLIKSPCFYCGRLLKSGTKQRKRFKLNGIDRMDNDIGYTITNSVPCCRHCNVAKSTQTMEEFLRHIKLIFSYLRLNNKTSLLELARDPTMTTS